MAKFHTETINPLLSERRVAMLADAVGRLDAAVEAGNVPSTLFTKAKAVINLAVDEAIDEFNRANRDYDFDTLVLGAYNVPAALKEAVAKGATKRASLLVHMLPLHELLQSAKPHIVKRTSGGQAGTLPPSKSKDSMTCQCCARPVCARTGVIAHHGYLRPGEGWQSASCFGARHLPFEAGRDRLGDLIVRLRFEMAQEERAVEDVEAERAPVRLLLPDRAKEFAGDGRRPTRTVVVTRDTFNEVRLAGDLTVTTLDFDDLKARHVSDRRAGIEHLRRATADQAARYDGWRRSRAWNASGRTWRALEIKKEEDCRIACAPSHQSDRSLRHPLAKSSADGATIRAHRQCPTDVQSNPRPASSIETGPSLGARNRFLRLTKRENNLRVSRRIVSFPIEGFSPVSSPDSAVSSSQSILSMPSLRM